jgi:general secretion pathway protein J
MRRPNSGFTLIEVLVATTVTALLLATAYGVFGSVSRVHQRLREDAEGCRLARALCDRLGRELRSAICRSSAAGMCFEGGDFRDDRPFLRFSTTAGASAGTGVVVVRYQLRGDDDENLRLLRNEHGLLEKAREDDGVLMTRGIRALRVRFHDGNDWRDDWRSGGDCALPGMVEIALELRRNGRILPFLTAFEVAPLENP